MTTPDEKINYALSRVEGATPGPWAAHRTTDRNGETNGYEVSSMEDGTVVAEVLDHKPWVPEWDSAVTVSNREQIALSPLIPAALRLAKVLERSQHLIPTGQPEYRETRDALDAFLSLLPEPKKED